MRKQKGILGWIVIAVALAVLMLMLTMCTGSCSSEPEPAAAATEAAETAQTEQTAAPETTASAEETTGETTEETTEATEETVEETKAATTPTTEPEDDEDYGEEDPYVELPDPGTPENPYIEVRKKFPAEVETVKIPRDTQVSYLIVGAAGSVLTVEDPSFTLTVNGTVYTADETTGIVTVDLTEAAEDPVLTLSHSGRTATACVVKLTRGDAQPEEEPDTGEPELLTDTADLTVVLDEGDADGRCYRWISTVTGQVELTLKDAGEAAGADIAVTVGDSVYRLSESTGDTLVVAVTKDQQIELQVIALPLEDGSYPARTETVVWTLLPTLGTAENPETLESIEAIAVTLEQGDSDGYHYLWTPEADGEATLTVTEGDLELIVTLGDTTLSTADTQTAVLTFSVEQGQQVHIQAIAPAGEEGLPAVSATVSGVLTQMPAESGEPEELDTLESVAVSLSQGDSVGYNCRWTADEAGRLMLTAESGLEAVCVTVTGPDGTAAEMPQSGLTVELAEGQTVTVHVIARQTADGQYPSAELVLKGTFTTGSSTSEDTENT